MGATLGVFLRVEAIWIVLEMAAMSLFALAFTLQVRRVRTARAVREASRPLAPVVCIDRYW